MSLKLGRLNLSGLHNNCYRRAINPGEDIFFVLYIVANHLTTLSFYYFFTVHYLLLTFFLLVFNIETANNTAGELVNVSVDKGDPYLDKV